MRHVQPILKGRSGPWIVSERRVRQSSTHGCGGAHPYRYMVERMTRGTRRIEGAAVVHYRTPVPNRSPALGKPEPCL